MIGWKSLDITRENEWAIFTRWIGFTGHLAHFVFVCVTIDEFGDANFSWGEIILFSQFSAIESTGKNLKINIWF